MSDPPLDETIELTLDSTKNLSKILRTMGHPKRIEVLSFLSKSNREYSTILRQLRISRTALANHLNLLVESGLIKRMERGSYSLTKDGRSFYTTLMQTYLDSQAYSQLHRSQIMESYGNIRKKGCSKLKSLKKLKWQPRWVSHLGAVEASLKFLKQKISPAWIYGGTGHAFIINIAKDLCPSGPTAWRTMMLHELSSNLGYRVDGIFAVKTNPEFPRLQEKAWNHAIECIDKEIPCYGWELEAPEFYNITGYDDVGYHYSGPGCENGKGPKPWRDLGNTGIGILEVYSVHPSGTANPVKAIKQALVKSLYHASNPEDTIFPNYRSGLTGYDWWISAIEYGSAQVMGHAYNAGVWAECRKFAAQFLKEARKHVTGDIRILIDAAQKQYKIVASNLESISKDYPFTPGLDSKPIGVEGRTTKTVDSLKNAKAAEESGMTILQDIVKAL
ncbi:MAG: ArsR/SmtB family transcription factor [Candidatus Thorarchaeota archaeon]